MQRILVLLAALLISAHASAASPSETLAAFHAALHAGEQAKALAMLSPAITIYESGHVERSRDEYLAHHLPADIEFAKVTTRKVLRTSEKIDGNIALIVNETETTGAFKGKDVRSLGTETIVLEKKGDGWVLMHVHWSSRKR